MQSPSSDIKYTSKDALLNSDKYCSPTLPDKETIPFNTCDDLFTKKAVDFIKLLKLTI